VNEGWLELALSNGFRGVAHARQLHGKEILIHFEAPVGLSIGPDADGHISSTPGAFMAVTVADCVPVFLADPHRRVAAIVHAGWRGTVAGILETGLDMFEEEFGASREDVLLHLGPAICERCYEVGPEVHTALGLPEPPGPAPVDLRGVLVERAMGSGLMRAHITRSSFCTLCAGSPFFSHRRGESERQVGFVGIRSN
jgi:hypothetical protein